MLHHAVELAVAGQPQQPWSIKHRKKLHNFHYDHNNDKLISKKMTFQSIKVELLIYTF